MKIESIHIKSHLLNEAYSMLARLSKIKPFELTMPSVSAANISLKALFSISSLLNKSHKELNDNISNFIAHLNDSAREILNPAESQNKFTLLKLRFNSILDQLDIFADVLCQRSEHDVGIWLAGLDALADDALAVCKTYTGIPELMIFLERGHGAAIRRAKTRLPGGDLNPVGVIQIPRERMVGSGIASSLIHEVGHQAAAILELLPSVKAELKQMQSADAVNKKAWELYDKWISEIVSDFWSVAHLGICSTLGLMGVVSLPSYFQFRIEVEDPHPAPYIRVMLSCAMGNAMFPHPQWQKYASMWDEFYPQDKISPDIRKSIGQLKAAMNKFVSILINHRPKSLGGKRLIDIFPVNKLQPAQLSNYYDKWNSNPMIAADMRPSFVFAIIGQAKADNKIDAGQESRFLSNQLVRWAYKRMYQFSDFYNNKILNKNYLLIN